ncbi:MAG: 6,7-dimethyl-8-ribityllumazine synthase [Candidatus Micrarchaeota archaeon]|nr:6,7-dimethyl-8-ribityllumazine synthase [Candidatus Micrarchaeota archaeon]
MRKVRLGIAVSSFNSEITKPMLAHAQSVAKKMGAQVCGVMWVPGAYELPLASKKLLSRRDIDAVVALGAVIRGKTKHDEAICFAVSKALAFLQVKSCKPIGFGVLGPGISWKQAQLRMKEHARRSVEAAVWMASLVREGKKPKSTPCLPKSRSHKPKRR